MSNSAAPGNPAPVVLADLLLASVEADRIEETYELLEELVGSTILRAAHGIVFGRIETALDALEAEEDPGLMHPEDNVFGLVRRLRADTSRRSA